MVLRTCLATPASISLLVHSREAERKMQSPFWRRGSAHFAAAAAGSSQSSAWRSSAAAASSLGQDEDTINKVACLKF